MTNFTKKLIFKKHRVSCHNLFPTSYVILQEDHNDCLWPFFILGQWDQTLKSPPRPLKKVKFHICFYQSLKDIVVKWFHIALEG